MENGDDANRSNISKRHAGRSPLAGSNSRTKADGPTSTEPTMSIRQNVKYTKEAAHGVSY